MGVGQVGYILNCIFLTFYFKLCNGDFAFRGFCRPLGKLGSASLEWGPHRLWLHVI